MFGKKTGIVLELQRDCLDSSIPVSSILRKAKAIASKLDLEDLAEWMNQELNGYTISILELPSHRVGRGSPRFWNPFRGYCPIIVQNDSFGDLVSTYYLNQGVSELEDLTSKSSSKGLIFKYPAAIQEALQRGMEMDMECSLHFSSSQVKSALDYVRNKILDWTLELEKRGVIGEGFSFGNDEKKEANAVTNHIYGSTIGVLGNVGRDANNSKFFTASDKIDFEQINYFISKAVSATNGLPENIRRDVQKILKDVEEESQNLKRASKIKAYLVSLRTILEGAGGNLVAQAILSAMA